MATIEGSAFDDFLIGTRFSDVIHAGNGDDFVHGGDGDDFIFGDTFDWLRRLAKKGRAFDAVVLDPPTFSQSMATNRRSMRCRKLPAQPQAYARSR